ncbi:hypothetical protein Tco_1530414 [Tanacetum coccineum]
MTTAGTRAVVNTGKGKMDNALKKSRWVWRPKGNYMDHESKEKGSFILKKFEDLFTGSCSGDKGGNAKELVSTARPDIDAARQEDSDVEPRTPPTTTSIFDDEDITMAQTLIKMKEEKAKEKGVSIKDVDDSSRPARSILTLKPLPTIDPKYKGKGVLKESRLKSVLLSEQMISICDMVGQYIQKKEEEKLIAEEQAAKTRYWKILICYDDDNDEEYYEAFYFDDDHIEEKSSGSTTTQSDISLSKYDSFIFDLLNDPFPPADRSDFYHEEFADELAHIRSPPEYDCFYFKSEPNPGELTSIVDSGIRENVPSSKNVNLPFEDDQSPLLAYDSPDYEDSRAHGFVLRSLDLHILSFIWESNILILSTNDPSIRESFAKERKMIDLRSGSGDKGGNAKELVSSARPEVSTARPDIDAYRKEDSVVEPRTPPTTTSIFDDEDITMAQTLIKMKEEKAKEKGVSIKDVDDSSRPARSILTLKPLPTIDPKYKGKWVLKESPINKVQRSDLDAAQIAKDAKIARLVHEKELAEMEREREERQRQDQAFVDYIASLYDEVQAKMDASEELAARLQMEEREMYTIEERSKLLAEFFERRKKLLAEERVAAVRNKPPTRTQLRSLMMTYLKHTGKYRHNQLNKKTFEEIQALYIKEQERDADFVPIGSERDEKMIDKMNKKAAGMDEEEVPESTKVEVKKEGHEENIRKRSGRRLKMKATKKSKRQKTDSDLEEEEQLRAYLKIVPDEEEEIDYEVLGMRVFRANGSSRYIKTFTEMVSRFDRLDFIELHSLVMQRFSTTTPEGIDLVLYGGLGIMFEETEDDEIWKNQEKWIIKS